MVISLPKEGRAHFIGICGVGMSATAKLLKEHGWEISGSDEGFYPPVSDYLTKFGLPCHPTYKAENIPDHVDLVVIGKHAKLTPEENAEVKAAYDRKLKVVSFPDVLSELTKHTENIVVCGSFGKSTTSALLTHCLIEAGLDPSYFIGAIPLGREETSHLGSGKLFILEGDEYPSANWDSSSKFLHLHAHDILLTSLEHDHVNVFPTLEDYITPYRALAKQLPPTGFITACLDGAHVREFLTTITSPSITYALDTPADWRAQNIHYGEVTTFDLVYRDTVMTSLETILLGKHNIENIVGTSALLLTKRLVSIEQLQAGIRSFKGIKRRLDQKTEKSSVLIYEGFGSSYAKAASAIAAIKTHFPEKRLIIIFEPHTFSWRNRDALHWYDDIFKPADKVLVYKPPEHGASTHPQLTHDEIVNRIAQSGTRVLGIHNQGEAFTELEHYLQADDVILFLTSGELGGMIESIPPWVELKFPKK